MVRALWVLAIAGLAGSAEAATLGKTCGQIRYTDEHREALRIENSDYFMTQVCPKKSVTLNGKKTTVTPIQVLELDEDTLKNQKKNGGLDWSGQKGYFTRLYRDTKYRAQVAKAQSAQSKRDAAPTVCFETLETSGSADKACSGSKPKVIKVVGTGQVTSDLQKF